MSVFPEITASSARPRASFFQPKAFLEAYPHLYRNRLDFWKRKMPQVDFYSEEQLLTVAALNRGYQLGFKVEQIEKCLRDPLFLRQYTASRLATVGIRFLEILGRAQPKDLPPVLTREIQEVLDCGRVWLFGLLSKPRSDPEWEYMASGPPRDESDSRAMSSRLMVEHLINQLNKEKHPLDHAISLFGSKLHDYLSDFSEISRPLSILALPASVNGSAQAFWILAENKLDRNGLPNKAAIFDTVDEVSLELISRYYAACWRIKVIQCLEATAKHCDRAVSLNEIMGHVLSAAMKGTGAYRGEVTGGGPKKQDVRIIATCGKTNFEPGSTLPNPSIARLVFETREAHYSKRVQEDPFYKECDPRTQSEFAVPITDVNTREIVAVLNLESSREDGFSEDDRIFAQLCAGVASQWSQLILTKHDVALRLFPTPAETSPLHSLPAEIKMEFSYPHALVYVADYRNALLRVVLPSEHAGFAYSLNDVALCTKVFNDAAPYYCPDPSHDLFVNRKGVERFGITGPILGVPLKFGNLVLGVVVLWGLSDAEPPNADVIGRIERFISRSATGTSTTLAGVAS